MRKLTDIQLTDLPAEIIDDVATRLPFQSAVRLRACDKWLHRHVHVRKADISLAELILPAQQGLMAGLKELRLKPTRLRSLVRDPGQAEAQVQQQREQIPLLLNPDVAPLLTKLSLERLPVVTVEAAARRLALMGQLSSVRLTYVEGFNETDLSLWNDLWAALKGVSTLRRLTVCTSLDDGAGAGLAQLSQLVKLSIKGCQLNGDLCLDVSGLTRLTKLVVDAYDMMDIAAQGGLPDYAVRLQGLDALTQLQTLRLNFKMSAFTPEMLPASSRLINLRLHVPRGVDSFLMLAPRQLTASLVVLNLEGHDVTAAQLAPLTSLTSLMCNKLQPSRFGHAEVVFPRMRVLTCSLGPEYGDDFDQPQPFAVTFPALEVLDMGYQAFVHPAFMRRQDDMPWHWLSALWPPTPEYAMVNLKELQPGKWRMGFPLELINACVRLETFRHGNLVRVILNGSLNAIRLLGRTVRTLCVSVEDDEDIVRVISVCPLLEKMVLTCLAPRRGKLARVPQTQVTDVGMVALSRAPRLREVHLKGCSDVRAGGLAALAANPSVELITFDSPLDGDWELLQRAKRLLERPELVVIPVKKMASF